MDSALIIQKGQRCIDIEIDALRATRDQLDDTFSAVAQTVLQTIQKGKKLIFSGIGKNAHICEKLVGTFNSIGAPSCFIDPVRALHGDMGLCCEGDTLLAFSHSGETEELIRFLPMIKRFDLQTIAVTSRPESTLAKLCHLPLLYRSEREACPLDLAPTASTAAAMAIGDAVAMVTLEMRRFGKQDFAKYHPGGSLGRNLAPRVEELMRGGDRLATLPQTASGEACLRRMSATSSGCIALTSEDGTLAGVLTDGDIRRVILSHPDFLREPISAVMTKSPIAIRKGAYAAEALKIFETHRIDDLIVIDEANQPIGIIDGQDLTKLRVV